jgi:glucose-1-phosphate cytidylyltransferase
MRVVILAGGLGTRLSEETEDKPKPMVLIDDKPLLWHLMNIFSIQGYCEFVIALGYKGNQIKRWLWELHDLAGDFSISTQTGNISRVEKESVPEWTVSAIETGLLTQTGGRIKQILTKVNEDCFIVTYGDGLANIDINQLVAFHQSHGKLATVTAVRPPARFGSVKMTGNQVSNFGEKVQAEEGWINGGFFVLNRKVADYIHSDSEPFETGALPRLVADQQLMAFRHEGFWQAMDTLRERNVLTEYAKSSNPPWLQNPKK